MKRVRISITLDKNLFDKLELERGMIARSKYIEHFLQQQTQKESKNQKISQVFRVLWRSFLILIEVLLKVLLNKYI